MVSEWGYCLSFFRKKKKRLVQKSKTSVYLVISTEDCKDCNTYCFSQLLFRDNNHIWWIPNSCGSPSDVGENYFCNQDMPGIKIKHLT